LGNSGKNTSVYTIILLSIALLFFPVQQGYGFFELSPELNETQLMELYKLEQSVKAEQVRDENFVLQIQQNPYLDTPSNTIISFKEINEEHSLKSLDREDKNFQLIKDEQIAIAERKCKEILGGKTISNLINNEPINKKSDYKFKIDNQTGFMKRNSDNFQNYTSLQISMAEEFRDNNWIKMISQESSNPYQNNEPVMALSNNEEKKMSNMKLDNRQSEEFKNLAREQVSLAENIRNEMLDYSMTGNPNPYLNASIEEKVEEQSEESPVKTNTNIIITGWADPTYVTDKSDFNKIDREYSGFEIIKALELEIAQNTLNEMLSLSNSDEESLEIIISTNENNKLTDIERDDQGFEFFKNKQIVMAEQKLMEILGQKNIHNSDY
jgi:hypothetical protein